LTASIMTTFWPSSVGSPQGIWSGNG